MSDKNLYDSYHKGRILQKRVIGEKNFTYRNIIEALNSIRYGDNILDIGSGVGTIDFYLASLGKQVIGIEIAQEAFEIAKDSARIMGLYGNTKFVKGDFLNWKEDFKFDLVICSEVLEHLYDDKKALSKIYKLLKNNGLVLITVPSKNAPLFRWGLASEFDNKVGHLRRYDFSEIKSLITKNNFKIIKTKKSEGVIRNLLFMFKVGNFPIRVANKFPFISDLLTYIDKIFINLFGESNLIILCKKV
jgi:SAM-dependent methyltransferase